MVINALIGAVSTLVLFFLLNGIKKTDRRLPPSTSIDFLNSQVE